MWNIRAEILTACRKVGVTVAEVDTIVANQIRTEILSDFCEGLSSWPLWIWEHLPDRATLKDEEGWRLIGEFEPHSPVILVLNPSDDPAVFEFATGQTAASVLAECVRFEVYFTNRKMSYLLIYNHHDCVFACGEARNWLEQRGQPLQNIHHR